MKPLPIGIHDFKEIIESNCFYVDKTNFIKDFLTNRTKVTLFTRPRRFGKTLNMSMLSYFFDIQNAKENKKLFYGLNIEKAESWKEQGQYPVIFVSFKDVKKNTLKESIDEVYQIIFSVLNKESYIYEKLPRGSKKIFDNLFDNRDSIFLNNSLKYLSQFLYEYYNKKVIVIIDEYDTPIISAHENGYYTEAIKFFRDLYSAVMKDNIYLQFGAMTGIVRVAKEGIFSGLNNPDVYTILEEKFANSFGLTENDVYSALKEYNLESNIEGVKTWYNGYKFANYELYNPWSIIKYLNTQKLDAYWVNTSDNYLIKEVLNISNKDIYTDLVDLFNGKEIDKYIDKEMVFEDLDDQDSLWTLLLFSGYLTIVKETNIKEKYTLKIPNNEIYAFFKKSFMKTFIKNKSSYFNDVLESLKNGIITGSDSFEDKLKDIFLTYMSYYDAKNDENSYHNFILGITVGFAGEYITHSNIESGKGRPDLILQPIENSKTGYIFEFKIADSVENLDKKLDEGIKQIVDNYYGNFLYKNGIGNIIGIAIAFCGKELKVKYKML
jgi:hypothetical protein